MQQKKRVGMCACVQHRSQHLTLCRNNSPYASNQSFVWECVMSSHIWAYEGRGSGVRICVVSHVACKAHSLNTGPGRTCSALKFPEISWTLSLSLSVHKMYWILRFRKSCLSELINFAWKHCSIWSTAPSGFINLLEQLNKTNSPTLLDALLRCHGAFYDTLCYKQTCYSNKW